MKNMKKKSERIYWIDAAKAINIFFVFYAHISGTVRHQGSSIALSQFKFICSFNMPFFFFVAGFFFKRKYLSTKKELVTLFYKRIIPVLLFSLATIPFWMIRQYRHDGVVQYWALVKVSLHYLHGETNLNNTVWFLICLFTTEVLAIVLLPKITKNYQKALVAILSISLGLILTNKYHIFEQYLGIYKNTWYIHEALVALGFYITGHLTFHQLHKLLQVKTIPRLALVVLFTALTILTFDLNNPYEEFTVIMSLSSHGSNIYFIMTAIFGTLSTIFISTFIPKSPVVDYVGKNTLILLGTSGFCLHFLNPYLATLYPRLDSAIWVTGYNTIVSIISILLSVPVIYLLNKYFPQLVGRPYQQGPLLPSLDSIKQLDKNSS